MSEQNKKQEEALLEVKRLLDKGRTKVEITLRPNGNYLIHAKE
jgi:hypothetical protein